MTGAEVMSHHANQISDLLRRMLDQLPVLKKEICQRLLRVSAAVHVK